MNNPESVKLEVFTITLKPFVGYKNPLPRYAKSPDFER